MLNRILINLRSKGLKEVFCLQKYLNIQYDIYHLEYVLVTMARHFITRKTLPRVERLISGPEPLDFTAGSLKF